MKRAPDQATVTARVMPAARYSAHQEAVTIVAEVVADRAKALRSLLAGMGEDPGGNNVLSLGVLPRVHYARFVLLDATTDLTGRAIPPTLLYFSDVDGPAKQHLRELAEFAGVDTVFGHCQGYPESPRGTSDQRYRFLRQKRTRAAAAYVNSIGRTVEQIRAEGTLRERIEEFLDARGGEWSGMPREDVRRHVQQFVAGEGDLAWALAPAPPFSPLRRARETLDLLRVPAIAIAALPVAVAVAPLYIMLLRAHEKSDPSPPVNLDPGHYAALTALEDHGPQNQYNALGFVKPGRFRLFTASTVLWLTDYSVRHFFANANLAGVKTIHFARWVFLDDKRRMVFASNYDGSVESYNNDFIDKIAWGLNVVFSNGYGYPRTDWLIRNGARDEQHFKTYLRAHQVPTDVWFSAYPNLTALNIENNAKIREGLSGEMTPSEVERWLALL